jgi:hypothetical protein
MNLFSPLWSLILIIIIIYATFTEGKRKSIHKRIGFLQDPPGLHPNAYLSPVYITFNTFIHGFVSTRGLFAPKREASIPGNSTYTSMMNAVIESEEFKDREELAHFLSHALYFSKGFTRKECPSAAFSLALHSYHGRGYCPLRGEEAYRAASLEIFKDDRLVLAPELISFDEQTNWRTSILAWKAIKKSSETIENHENIDKIFQILRSYYLLK